MSRRRLYYEAMVGSLAADLGLAQDSRCTKLARDVKRIPGRLEPRGRLDKAAILPGRYSYRHSVVVRVRTGTDLAGPGLGVYGLPYFTDTQVAEKFLFQNISNTLRAR